MSKQYETTLILTPVFTEGEVNDFVSNITEFLKTNEAEIVHQEYWGLRQLAYPIEKKTTGHYYTIEFTTSKPGDLIEKIELNLRRDENVLRYLTIMLDKYAVEFNEKKRKGLIGKKRDSVKETEKEGA